MSEKRSLMIAGAGAATFLALAGQVAATAVRAPSPLETVLFGSLEIVFVGAAVYWLAQQAAERSFQESRKQAGFGVLRRIREASETLERLESIVRGKKELIARHGKLDQALTLEYLDHILSVAGELKGKVLASREDWQGAFEAELRELRGIEALSRRRREAADEGVRGRLAQEIEARRAALPVAAEALALDFAALVTPEEAPAGERQPSPSLKAVAPAAPNGQAAVRAKGNGAPRKAIPVA